jgi:N-acetylmuramoyl-L-alanine amidase
MNIVIDPGHGGKDPGTRGWDIPERTFPPAIEKDLNLQYSLDLEKELIARDHQVTMTRRINTYLSLTQRVAIANSIKPLPDCFVSVHFNANASPKVRGAWAIYNNMNNRPSKLGKPLAECLAKEMGLVPGVAKTLVVGRPVYDTDEDGNLVKKDGSITVVRDAKMWAALVEICFLSNYEDEKLAVDPIFRAGMVRALAAGIERWGKEYYR